MEKKRLTKPVGDRLFIKENITSPWEPANLADLKSILSDELIPYSSEGKLKIPQFGFGRKIGETLNEQIYPTRYIVIDLDTPPENKKDLSTNSGFEEWSNFFITGYNKIVEYDSIPYWIMYLTPSMCGLRFIVKLKNNVANENEYIQALKDFLITLKNYEIGEKYIDVRVNHSWFLPTYLKYYNERFARFNNPIVPESPKKEKESSRIEHNDLTKRELDNVVAQIEEKELDITTSYEDWLKIGFALTDFLGEEGREYYHRISKFYNGYDSQECNNQYNNCLRSQGKGITIGSLFWLAQKNGINLRNPNLIYSDSDILCFWKYDSKKKGLKIDIAQFYDYLENEGFAKYYIDPSNAGDIPIFVERDGFQIKQVNKERIIEHSAEFIRRLNVEDEIKSNIRNAFYLGSAKFSENNLATLSITKHPFIEDTKDKAYLFYNDIYLVITKDRVTKHKYEELDKCIWESDKINRDFKTRDFTDVSDSCDFYKFLEDICNIGELGEAKQRLTSIMSIIGYLLNSYKDPTNAKAIILMDSNTSANPQGGTGKSLLIEGLRKIRTSLVIEDGKRLNTKGRFEWVQIKRNTKIVAIDDIRERFNLQDLFSLINS